VYGAVRAVLEHITELVLADVQVTSGAAHALCSLARLSSSAGQRLAALMKIYMDSLKQRHPLLLNPPADTAARQTNIAHISRYACLACQVWYFGLYIRSLMLSHSTSDVVLHLDNAAYINQLIQLVIHRHVTTK